MVFSFLIINEQHATTGKKKKEDPTSLWASVIFQGGFSEDQNPGHQHCAKVDL